MFLRQLSSSGASFLPRGRPPLCRAGYRSNSASSSSLPPAPHPWWSVVGVPPRPPPRLPLSFHPAARHVSSGRTRSRPRSIDPVLLTGRSFSTSAGLRMERPDREPPHKRRRSAEEKRGEEREGHRGGGGGGGGGDGRPPQNQRLKDRSRERGEAAKGVAPENSRNKDRRRKDETPEGVGDSQPARSRTPKPEPAPTHKPNPWFREKGAGGHTRDRSRDGGQRAPSLPPPNPWKTTGVQVQPPPPGTWPWSHEGHGQPLKTLQRRWETPACSAGVQPPGGSRAFDFSVMSYNILSQELLQDNVYLYRHCPPAVLPWDHRLPNLLAEIQQHDADILCLQEVQEDHYQDQIKPALQALGYQCEYKKRTGSKPDGCAVVFKSSRLSLLSSNPVEFFRPGDALLDRDNVGLVLLLRPTDAAADPSASICVANTHLLYNPRRGDVKLAQLAILMAEIGRLSRLPDGSARPVVLCGDFNSTPWSPLYRFLTTGSLDYRGLPIGTVSGQESSPRGQRLLTSPIWSPSLGIDQQCEYKDQRTAEPPGTPTVEGAISNLTVEDLTTKSAVDLHGARIEHRLKLRSSYQHRLPPDGRPEVTTSHSRTAMTVDYILYTPESVALPSSLPGGRGLHLLGRLSLVGQSELEEVNGLPNRRHSSDHLPLLALFRFRR